MIKSFLTLEDVNTALYSNQKFYWHKLDLSNLPSSDFTNIKVDFTTIKKETINNEKKYTIDIHTNNWTKGFKILGDTTNVTYSLSDRIIFTCNSVSAVMLYMGPFTELTRPSTMTDYLEEDILNLNLKQLKTVQSIKTKEWGNNTSHTIHSLLERGYNLIKRPLDIAYYKCGYLLVNVLKTDFKFTCTQQLIVGKVNKVALGTDSEYKPDGDMIGEYTPSIRVLYNDKTLPVTYDNTLNDYTFDLDLTEETTEHKIHLKVLIDSNEVLNSTSTDVTLQSSFETINTLDKLGHLFSVGGVGRLGSDLTLTDDLTVNNDVYLIGNEHTISMASHKIIVPSDKIFKAEQTTFTNGENTIQQNEASKVELINCTFTDCTGLGSVIDCQIDVTSLDNPTDFTTILNKCTLNNNDMCILHGGNLTVTDCTVNGKISDDKYPYFLYQTDGEAHITGTVFNLTHNTQITTDIGYNSCIFTIGETANINYGDHKEYSQNNVTGFLENSRNISIINVTYYYSPIEDYVTLQSTKGYCHSVSSVDFVFKTNVQLTRGE